MSPAWHRAKDFCEQGPLSGLRGYANDPSLLPGKGDEKNHTEPGQGLRESNAINNIWLAV